VIRSHYEYEFDTLPGYCGAVLYRSDKTRVAKIIGMHVAGANNSSFGIASALNRENVNKQVKAYDLSVQCSLPLDEYQADIDCVQEKFVHIGGVGHVKLGVTDPSETVIRASPMYGWDGPPIKCPAILHGEVDGVDVKEAARKKLAQTEQKTLDPKRLELARLMTAKRVESRMAGKEERCVWTLDQAAFGDESKPYCDALDMTTSSGMPWSKKIKKVGKKDYLRKHSRWIHPEVKKACDERESAAKLGERKPTVWADHYKDECRLKANNKYKKPRLFSGSPLDYTLVVRQYFGSFMAHIMQGRIRNGVAVGINAHGGEWTLLARTLTSMSEDIFCGDFSNYDGTLHAEILYAVCDIINDWYDDGNRLVREVLFHDIVNSVHVAKNQMYVMDHGNPSGNPLTSILNSLYQLVAIDYVLLGMGKTVSEIFNHVLSVTYGDDNINAVAGGQDFLNLSDFTAAFKDELGMVLTCSDKDGKPFYCMLDQADFLSRRFRYEEGYCYAPRDWKYLSLVFNWIKSQEPWESLALAYSECCFYELSHYDEDDFLHYSDKVVKYMRENGMRCSIRFPLDYYRFNLQKWAGSNSHFPFCWGI
jgi:hypothetical protein